MNKKNHKIFVKKILTKPNNAYEKIKWKKPVLVMLWIQAMQCKLKLLLNKNKINK